MYRNDTNAICSYELIIIITINIEWFNIMGSIVPLNRRIDSETTLAACRFRVNSVHFHHRLLRILTNEALGISA